MKKSVALFVTIFLCFWGTCGICATDSPQLDQVKLQADYEGLPLAFIKNQGQVDEEVLYYLKGREGTIYFTKSGIVYDLIKKEDRSQKTEVSSQESDVGAPDNPEPAVGAQNIAPNNPASDTQDQKFSRLSFTLKPQGANPEVTVIPQDELPGKVNSFIGNDLQKWHTNISTYKSVTYQGLYPGIDLKVYGTNQQMEYDFIVHPGADPKNISLVGEGIDGLEVDPEGNLLIKTALTDIKHLKPIIYQEVDGKRLMVEGSFTTAQNRIGFDIKHYNKKYPLTIDPLTLSYSTFLGGSGDDCGRSIAVDSQGCAYVTGYTTSSNFPTANAYDNSYNTNTDVFVAKFNAYALSYSTYLGGSSYDYGYGVAVDSSGCAYVTGHTASTNFPTANPYQATCRGSYDVFVTKLTAAGNALVYSTYLGGSSSDYGYGIAVDTAGCAYVTGNSYTSSNFPTVNAYQGTRQGKIDAFVTKFTAAGNTLSYSTYLGGASDDYGYGVAVDSSGCAYVTGYTASTNFPTVNPYQAIFRGNNDVFVTKFTASGNALSYSTYLGGSGNDYGYGIAADSAGCAYITGWTASSNFPTANAFDSSYNNYNDGFVTKFTADGSALAYSTYLGGGYRDYAQGIAVDNSGCAYVTGYTESSNFPSFNPYQATLNNQDVFVTKFTATGNTLEYSTFLGGSGFDYGFGIAVDSAGCAYVIGRTNSTNFPTVNPYQSANAGNYDVFISKLTYCIPIVVDFSANPTSGYAPLTVSFTDQSTNNPTGWTWDFGDGGTSNLQNPTHEYTSPGTYTVALMACNACGNDLKIKTNYITVTVSQAPVANFSANPTSSGSSPLTVTFTDQSTNSPTNWTWDFGDGGTSNLQNPIYEYTTPGTYTVSLTASNAFGNNTKTKTDYIIISSQGPVQYFYDDVGRLIKAQDEEGNVIEYTYDSNGNRQTKTITIP